MNAIAINSALTYIPEEETVDSTMQNPPEKPTEIAPPETWVERYGDYLYRFALSRLRNPEAAADCVQDTLMAGIKNFERFDGSRDIKFWLRGIMRNKIVDQIRKQTRAQTVDIDAQDEELIESFWFKYSGIATTNPEPWAFDPRKAFDRTEFWQAFEVAVDSLKGIVHQAFVLRVMEDLETEEVCKVLDITPNYLWVLLHRARQQIKEELESTWESEGKKS